MSVETTIVCDRCQGSHCTDIRPLSRNFARDLEAHDMAVTKFGFFLCIDCRP